MNFHVLTLFPEAVENIFSYGILKKAKDKKIINLNTVNIRNFSKNKHKQTDDYPYGGGCGMVMQAEPIYEAFLSIKQTIISNKNTKVVYLSPQGKVFSQKMAEKLSKDDNIIFLCGHYEGVDERIIEEIVTEEISIGDYILTGGELAASVVINAISRFIPGVLGKEESFQKESFSDGLLEHPQYTRPEIFLDRKVPEVLLSGNHKNIDNWRKQQSIERTKLKRPDLLKNKSF